MEQITLNFTASEQALNPPNSQYNFASNTVSYIKAVFDLGENWSGYDSVRAVWNTDFECISTVLDSDNTCIVPQEVLKRTGKVMVNLVGSIVENDELTDRLTTYPAVALTVNANAKICGTETAEITPSQFEQYVAMVVAEVEKVTGMTATAVALPEGSAPTAVYENGVLTLGIPKGDKGETGNGISSVEFNADYSLTFNFTESEPYTTPSIRGERGAQGYGIVSVEKIGTAGLVDTYQVNYEDSSVPPTTFTVTNGAKGDTGNGISSVTKTGTVGLVDTYRITFTNGGHYDFNVTNGAKGDTGATGNGIATIAKTSTSGLVDTYTITFTDGTSTTFEVTNGQDGEVTYDELSELLPTETASGDIASFNDGQAVIPAVSVVATITPIQGGSGTPSPSNVRPISGHDEVGVSVVGKNLFGGIEVVNALQQSYSGIVVNTANESFHYSPTPAEGYKQVVGIVKTVGKWFPFKENTQYTFIIRIDTISTNNYLNLGVAYTDGTNNGGFSPESADSDGWIVFTTPVGKSVRNLYGGIYTTTSAEIYYNDFGIFEGVVTKDQFETYNGQTYTTTLPSTTYGGTLDLVSGVLTVTDGYIASYNGETLPSTWISDRDVYASGTTPTIGAQVVYKLATPQTYQLTPQQIDTLKGQNNITATSGQVSVTYKADIQKYIDNAIATFA